MESLEDTVAPEAASEDEIAKRLKEIDTSPRKNDPLVRSPSENLPKLMPDYFLEFYPEAIAETRVTFQWHNDQNKSVAKAFLVEFNHTINQTEEAPD